MKIGIVGCAGRMGQMLVQEVTNTDGCELTGGTEGPGNPALGSDVAAHAGLSACGLEISEDAAALFAAADVIIDFTLPVATPHHLELAKTHNTALILGTTGHDADGLALIEAAAKDITIVKAMNFSIGVNVLFALTEQLSGILDDDYDIEIMEMHHKHKVDAPSGTAIGLGEAAAKGRGVKLDDVSARGRDGITGARNKGDIGFTSLRGGEVVGEHTVVYAGDSERVELVHKAASRGIFSKGAVRAASWTEGQAPGLYDMLDVLGFK
ncbi:MAG: 4-hydroxy-tetrahydrodipicolinate reductase [Rhodospirillaceae bacterium]|jgi:4-hydroxy-tetrahydrodipicolinate reductase|nr:4-hydroxy-tetrahydrodipicolinate reductase [Rhodospirillaceae bacterium]MBT4939743.1 4-hydroxy-tetrahydrodipicolinate reductase [Rhodospirillaceae bacterium]MBT7268915.1 4-hydroxy-tetrahydrodipicolinate reductase [Rhodospirillaceae bacterium]